MGRLVLSISINDWLGLGADLQCDPTGERLEQDIPLASLRKRCAAVTSHTCTQRRAGACYQTRVQQMCPSSSLGCYGKTFVVAFCVSAELPFNVLYLRRVSVFGCVCGAFCFLNAECVLSNDREDVLLFSCGVFSCIASSSHSHSFHTQA